MNLNRNLIKTLLAAAVAVGTLCSSSAAFAATGSHAASTAKAPGAKERVLKRGLYAVGIDAAVAKAHGYKVVTYANGDEQSVPINPKSHLPKGPIVVRSERGVRPSNSSYDKETNSCGSAWIQVQQTGTDRVLLTSGFTVASAFDPATAYLWDITLNDANGLSDQGGYGTLSLRTSWSGSWSNLYQYKYTIDYLSTGEVWLASGTICDTALPGVSIDGLN